MLYKSMPASLDMVTRLTFESMCPIDYNISNTFYLRRNRHESGDQRGYCEGIKASGT